MKSRITGTVRWYSRLSWIWRKFLDKWKEKELTEPEKEKPLELEKTAEKAPKADIQTAKGKGKKQSVLQALRERQAKLKAQETGQTEQKTQGRRKGEPEL